MEWQAIFRADRTRTDAGRAPASGNAFVDTQPVAVTLRKLSDAMHDSPRMAAQRKLAEAMHNSPRVMAQRKLSVSMSAATAQREEDTKPAKAPLKPRASSLGVAQLDTEITYSEQQYAYGKNKSTNVGKEMNAKLDPTKMLRGQSANLNSAQDEMMGTIRAYWGITGGDLVKGHLLNDNLGGPAMNYNLYPITRGANKDHLTYVENAVKGKVWNDHTGINYKVTVDGKPDIAQGAASFICTIKYWNPKTNVVGNNVTDAVRINSDLNDVRATGDAVDMSGSAVDSFSNPKKPASVQKPKTKVSELTDQEKRDRKDQT